MKNYCAALLLCLPVTAFAYPIDMEKHMDGVKVDATAYDTAYDLGAITLENYGQVPAACEVTFRNGPEAPRVRRINVPAGKRADVTAKFTRQIIKLRVTVNCAAE